MRITMFTNTYLPHVGGVARSVNTYEEEFRRRGFDINIIAPEFEGAEESTEHVFRVPAIQNFNGSDFSLRLPQPYLLSEHIDQLRPQLIHSHHPFLLGDAALRTAYERQLPLVFTHHTMYEQYTHYVPLDSDAMKRVAIQMATEYCNLCHHVIAPSESIEALLRKRGVNVPITTIPTGIDLKFFGGGNQQRFREKVGIPQDALVVGHVGRLAAEKNLTFLTNALGKYLADHEHAVFVVVGDGPARREMVQILESVAAPNQIVFVGRQTGQDLADAYAAMDVFAFASQSETQGLVIAEAMAASTPVVALDGPGIREIVDERNGRLLAGDATEADFVEALTLLSENRQRLRRIAEDARLSVESYGLKSCADRLAELYTTLIGQYESKHDHDLTTWELIQGRLEAEWNLMEEKASALSAAVIETEATRATLT
ncbi:glycosyltransferase [Rubripirellula reticaptiva]|uniref:Alpha-monoglucosyldiacylglycerol synthase n=1 Tax=Rubripirellula reticaptiva TaxID=2528013 RepID=A0A5C6EGM0_9BACT|nr:glycosyltransferase [Rubripirellula reticaptiva]TWU46861.1 Alpha-monoglucosyldiacylglycerol synthase [Rubripirellula reticaptiva]